MCEIFPEVNKCCICCSLRVGMLFICILSITTGSLILNITLKASDISLGATMGAGKNTSDIASATKHTHTLALSVAVAMGFIFVACGVILLFANLFDEEGYIQIFVWLIFLNIVIGFGGIIYMAGLCSVSTCILSKMDWLTASFILIFVFVYLIWWFYFISVANSYILQRMG